MSDRIENARAQLWRYLELGQWANAAYAAQYLMAIDAANDESQRLAQAAQQLAEIAEGPQSVDDERLEDLAGELPRLGELASFRELKERGRLPASPVLPERPPQPEAVDKGQKQQHDAAPPERSAGRVRRKPADEADLWVIEGRRRSDMPALAAVSAVWRIKGWKGVGISVLLALCLFMIADLLAYVYLQAQPMSLKGAEHIGRGATDISAPWNGLKDLDGPVSNIILGDSSAEMNLQTGPISDALGGDTINLGNVNTSSLMMDAWMLQYYVNRFGAPENVIVCRTNYSYSTQHLPEFMAEVPLGWGYWEELEVVPAWEPGEVRDLFFKKYFVLYSKSDVLAPRLLSPLRLFAQPHGTVKPSRRYTGGVADKYPSQMDDLRSSRPDWLFGEFTASEDCTVALSSMSALARREGFQLYIVVGPEWDEAYADPVRTTMVEAMKQYVSQFVDHQNVHLILEEPLVFTADEMQNPNHLRSGPDRVYTDAVLSGILAIRQRPVD